MSVIADKINFFQQKGYVIFEQIIPHDLIDRFAEDFANLVTENRPLKIILLEKSIFLTHIKSDIKKQQYLKYGRFVDLENYSALCKELVFYPVIANFLTNLYSGDRPTNLQTLTYKYSSQQGEHSDKYLVSPSWAEGYNRNSLTASWIALEDADESNGALVIYPGSHSIEHKKRLAEDFNSDYDAYVKYCQDICQQHGIKPEYFYARKGDVLFWHGDFIHAGGAVKNWARSRFSLVCHYANIQRESYSLSSKNCLSYRPRTSYRDLGYFYEDKIIDSQHIKLLVNSVRNWHHTIEFAPDITTSGVCNCQATLSQLDLLGLPQDCKDMRVLNLNCQDGFFALEMEARGAEVTAINSPDYKSNGFEVASKIKNSKIAYFTDNLNKLETQKYGSFDIILFLNIPQKIDEAVDIFDKINKLIKSEGTIFLETAVAKNSRQKKVDLLRQKISSNIRKIYSQSDYIQQSRDDFLRSVLEKAQIKIINHHINDNSLYLVAKKEKQTEEQTKFIGNIDEFTVTSISGWAINLERPHEPAIIVIWQNNRVLAIQLANRERSDLKEAGYGEGKYGFVISLPEHKDNSPITITATTPQGQVFPNPDASWLIET